MKRYNNDDRIVMTLDGGGTNFVFSAVKKEEQIVDSITLPASGHDLDLSLKTIIRGFKEVQSLLPHQPSAISFCLPAPANFELGIVGDLVNLTAYRGGIAVGPMLKEMFELPVFMNNDGDLFALGEYIAGFLPYINGLLKDAGSPKRFNNLFGTTFGTGFGGGVVRNGEIFSGDNSASGEINRMRNRLLNNCCSEETVNILGLRKRYAFHSEIPLSKVPEPKSIYEIGNGIKKGNKAAAILAFEDFGYVAAEAISNAITLVDGLVVIGGGLSNAHPLFLSHMVEEINRPYDLENGVSKDHLEVLVHNAEDPDHLDVFLKGATREINIPYTSKKLIYDPAQRIALGVTRLGTERAVSIGAFTHALRQLDKII